MQKRKLGNSNLEVSALGFGCMGMNFSYGVAHDENEMIALMHQAVDLAITFLTPPRSTVPSPTNPGRGGILRRPCAIK